MRLTDRREGTRSSVHVLHVAYLGVVRVRVHAGVGVDVCLTVTSTTQHFTLVTITKQHVTGTSTHVFIRCWRRTATALTLQHASA